MPIFQTPSFTAQLESLTDCWARLRAEIYEYFSLLERHNAQASYEALAALIGIRSQNRISLISIEANVAEFYTSYTLTLCGLAYLTTPFTTSPTDNIWREEFRILPSPSTWAYRHNLRNSNKKFMLEDDTED